MAKKLETFEDLYADELQDLFDAEKQFAEVLPEMARRASSDTLRTIFTDAAGRAGESVERLGRVIHDLGRDPSGHRCRGMEGLLQEGRERMSKHAEPHVLDAGLIVLAQKAEHYAMAGYGSACTFANMFNRLEDARILHDALDEKRGTDDRLTRLAKDTVNIVAHAQ